MAYQVIGGSVRQGLYSQNANVLENNLFFLFYHF